MDSFHRRVLPSDESAERPAIGWIFSLLVCGFCVWIFSYPVRHPELQLGAAQDDFYYYLKVAQDIAAGHGSTFDGTTLTNGYHPLYLLVLFAVSDVITHLGSVFRFLWAFDVICAMATFWLLRGFFTRRGANAWFANGIALLVHAFCMRMFFQQMEVSLTLPLGLALLTILDVVPERYSVRRSAAAGALAALTILSRLDSGFLVLLLLVAFVAIKEYRARLSPAIIAAFASTCGLPIVLYLAINHALFHRLLPVSGAAKQMKNSWRPSLIALHSLTGTTVELIAIACAALLFFVFAAARWARSSDSPLKPVSSDPRDRLLLPACLIFPLLHLAVLVELSDWRLWGWYSYPLRFSLLAATIIILRLIQRTAWAQVAAPAFCGAMLIGLALTRYHLDPEMLDIAHEARQLAVFERTHPGTYAMGDRAGMFGYLSPYPVVQTEGIMMGNEFLGYIRRQDDLHDVLRRYRVDYYVGFTRTPVGNCFDAVEPAQAGAMAPHLRGRFCTPPLATFADPSGTVLVFRTTPD